MSCDHTDLLWQSWRQYPIAVVNWESQVIKQQPSPIKLFWIWFHHKQLCAARGLLAMPQEVPVHPSKPQQAFVHPAAFFLISLHWPFCLLLSPFWTQLLCIRFPTHEFLSAVFGKLHCLHKAMRSWNRKGDRKGCKALLLWPQWLHEKGKRSATEPCGSGPACCSAMQCAGDQKDIDEGVKAFLPS